MRQNFEPKIWGPHAWFFLETIAMSYPIKPTEDEINYFKKFFTYLQYVIPCEKCRNNYKAHLEIYPLNKDSLSSRDKLFNWIVNIHNSVDPKKTRSLVETFEYYMKQYSNKENFEVLEKKCNTKLNKKLKKVIILCTFIMTIIFIYKTYVFFKKK